MTSTIYGIPNCSTVKKACNWFEEHAIAFSFYDFKKNGVTQALIEEWLRHVPIEQLLNRSSMTYRQLNETQKTQCESMIGAMTIMMAQPSIIKRPIVQVQGRIILGFNATAYQSFFQA